MSVYAYPQSKLISDITFRRSESGAIRAYIHARPEAGYEQLAPVIKALCDKGWKCVPINFEGKPALEVRGLRWESKLITELFDKGFIEGKLEKHKEKADHVPLKEWLRRRTLQGTGLFFIAADIGFIKYGHEEKRWEDVAGGVSYFAGSSEFAAFGNSDQSNLEIRNNVRKLIDYANNHNLTFDKQDAVYNMGEHRRKGAANKVYEVLKNYPGEVGNSFTALAGAFIAASALRHRVLAKFDPMVVGTESIAAMNKINRPHSGDVMAIGKDAISKKRIAGKMDVGLGLTTVASGVLGGWVKEKAKDPDKPKAHGMKAVWEWVQEKPLRISGYGYMVSTLCHAVSTYIERKEAKKYNNVEALRAVRWRAVFITCTIIGEILMTLSSKGHGEGVKTDNSTDDTMVAVTAQLIAKQPANLQPELIKNLSKFLGAPDVLARKDANIEELLKQQVDAMQKNPWIQCAAPHCDDVVGASVARAEETQKNISKSNVPAWQAKVTAGKDKPQPQLTA